MKVVLTLIQILFVSMWIQNSYADSQIMVAVVDTGLDLHDVRFKGNICKTGHLDLTGEGLYDTIGHGTHVAGLIKEYADKANYCMIIYKYIGSRPGAESSSVFWELRAFKAAIDAGARIINFSSGGYTYSPQEKAFIKSHPDVLFVTAAGNEGNNLDETPYYPAAYHLPNIIPVGNLDFNGKPYRMSNYAPWLVWEEGVIVSSYAIGFGTTLMTGTSMSTAIRTGKIINNHLKSLNN